MKDRDKKMGLWIISTIILAWTLYMIPQLTGFALLDTPSHGATTSTGYCAISVFTILLYLFAGIIILDPPVVKEGD